MISCLLRVWQIAAKPRLAQPRYHTREKNGKIRRFTAFRVANLSPCMIVQAIAVALY